MPQIFHIVRCFDESTCGTYQIHIEKKSSNQWTCKLCGAKQSIRKIYGRGSTGELRILVQDMNMKRILMKEKEGEDVNYQVNDYNNVVDCHQSYSIDEGRNSKEDIFDGHATDWNRFLDTNNDAFELSDDSEGEFTTDVSEFLNAKKRKGEMPMLENVLRSNSGKCRRQARRRQSNIMERQAETDCTNLGLENYGRLKTAVPRSDSSNIASVRSPSSGIPGIADASDICNSRNASPLSMKTRENSEVLKELPSKPSCINRQEMSETTSMLSSKPNKIKPVPYAGATSSWSVWLDNEDNGDSDDNDDNCTIDADGRLYISENIRARTSEGW